MIALKGRSVFEQIEKVYFRYDTIFSTDSVWTFGMVNKKLNFAQI